MKQEKLFKELITVFNLIEIVNSIKKNNGAVNCYERSCSHITCSKCPLKDGQNAKFSKKDINILKDKYPEYFI